MQPLVSVIVPVYNAEQYLPMCMDSLLRQTYADLEILLVDDGSTDGSPMLCDEYAARDGRVKVIHKVNGGLSDARNAALDVMSGDLVSFVDSDDWVEPDFISYLYKGLVGTESQISYCEVYRKTAYRIEFNVRHTDSIHDKFTALNELFFDRLENYAWNKLYTRDVWEGVRFPVGLNFEDIATIYKTFERSSRVAILSQPKYYYRIRKDSISGTKNFAFRSNIYRAIIGRYEDVAPRLPEYRPPLFRRVRNWYIHELCREFKLHPEREKVNLRLLDILAPFVARHKDEIADILNFEPLERKKLDAFAKGTPQGCIESLSYHEQMWKLRNKKR